MKNGTELYSSRNVEPNSEEFIDFFNEDSQLTEEMASTCEGEITLDECTKALSMMQNNKSPGSDGLTTEFYRAFWDIISTYVVNSFIRLILDIMEYTKYKDIPGVAVFLDFEKAFDSVDWNYIQKCLEATSFGSHLRQVGKCFLS